jgi:hypothetical protein
MAAELKAALQADYPDRDITVYAGDCNVNGLRLSLR